MSNDLREQYYNDYSDVGSLIFYSAVECSTVAATAILLMHFAVSCEHFANTCRAREQSLVHESL